MSGNSGESPTPMTLHNSSMEISSTSNVGQPDVSMSCPQQVSFVHNSSQRSSLRNASGNQPTPPPRSGSELTYGHLEQVASRRSFTSADTLPRNHHIQGFGFSSHLSQPPASCVLTSSVLSSSSMSSSRNTVTKNPASTITSLASAWRSQPSGNSGLQDTRLYHTLGRPMTTFNRSMEIDSSSADSSLRISMLPDNSQPLDPPANENNIKIESTEDLDRYGSIPQLEASPRRYNRQKDQNEFQYDTSGSTLPVPSRAPLPESPNEIPPKLPEKPSRRTNQISPPPLPPKKPTTKGLIGISSYGRPVFPKEIIEHQPPPDVVTGHEIYDFPPMPMLGSHKMDKEEAQQCIQDILKSDTKQTTYLEEKETAALPPVSVSELSKMSLIDLNTKLQSGQLPEEMKGMSILELVDFINEQVKMKKCTPDLHDKLEATQPVQGHFGMKPSFSDNFVCDNNFQPKPLEEEKSKESHIAVPSSESNAISPGPLSSTSKEVGFAFPPVNAGNSEATSNFPSLQEGISSGFDDDFTPFSINNQLESLARPESQAASDHSVLSKPEEFDRYAVFRELQMEEELIKAWKTPSDEEKVDDEAPEEEIIQEQEQEKPETYQNQPVCSSEGSPCSRSDTQSPLKSFSAADDQHAFERSQMALEHETVQEEQFEDPETSQSESVSNKRESQVPIFKDDDDESVTQSIRSDHIVKECNNHEETEALEDSLFSNTFGDETQILTTWATFDDGPEEPILQQAKLSSTSAKQRHTSSDFAFQDNFGDPIDWSAVHTNEEPQESKEEDHSQINNEDSTPIANKAQPIRQNSSESQHSIGKCKRFSHRQVDADHICRGHSIEATEDNSSTYTDWWPPSAEGAPQSTPITSHQKKRQPSGTGNEAYSATPDHKPMTNLVTNNTGWGEDAFADPLEAKFKIFSRVINTTPNNGIDRSMTPQNDPISDSDSGIIPKSDSVNIFSIKDDPFDDDFFQ